jgi:DNA-binding CsgD family transcriptional regulator
MTTYTTTPGALPYRQAATLSGIANGLTNKEIAAEAGISINVVKNSIDTLFFKFRLNRGKRSLLVAEAMRLGVLRAINFLLLVAVTACALNPPTDIERPTRKPTSIRTLRVVKTGRKTGRTWDDLIIPGLGDIA